MSESVSPEHSLGALVGRTGKVMSKALIHEFREAGHDLNLDHWIVLVHLWSKDGQNQQGLGEVAGRDKTTVTRAVDTLEQRNLVLRVPDQQDRRQRLIYLTHAGRNLQTVLMPLAQRVIDRATVGISPQDMACCKRVLSQVFERLNGAD